MDRPPQPVYQDSAQLSVYAAGLEAYRRPIEAMLSRLFDELLVERLWARDSSLWHPSAETQARIRERLGWLDLPASLPPLLDDWLRQARAQGMTDLLYAATGDAGGAARLWRDLAGAARHGLNVALLDTIEPGTVRATLDAVAWERTALALAVDADLTPDQDALARLVVAAHALAALHADLPLLVLAPPDSPLVQWIQSQTHAALLPLPSNPGARFGTLSLLGLVPAALTGWDVARLGAAAFEPRAACRRSDDPARNPGVWLGTTLAVLAQHDHDRLTLLAPTALLPLARWIAGFVSGSLSKHGRGFVAGVEAQRTKNKEQPAHQARTENVELDSRPPTPDARSLIVELRLARMSDSDLDQRCAALREAGAPVITIELADVDAAAALIVWWQVAVATTAVVIGLNPFDEPDTAARHAYLWRRLRQPEARVQPVSIEAETLPSALERIAPTIRSAGCLLIAAYLPPTPAVAERLHALRALLHRRFGAATVLIDPLRDLGFATQVLHAGRPCAALLVTADSSTDAAVPGVGWTLDDLRRMRIAADAEAWTRMQRPFVHVDLGDDPERGLRRCIERLIET
ncbi:MAG TPA: hypothetical protein VFZ66_12915 [Herpetosiphonaceae bacterium]